MKIKSRSAKIQKRGSGEVGKCHSATAAQYLSLRNCGIRN